ncbi:ABC transporter permease [Methylobacterium oryzihabitans]|uniref:ABC transporter permease n=2 Tax=Methylobacterium oryzihabitans TaxID=2499852 RepID=A0A3S2YSC5_9HYPH|nr:ABC transporter permease [Methylobacterium oryzihabitans]
MTGMRRAAEIGIALGAWIVRLVAVVLVIATFNFALVRAAPGDPAQVMAGQSGGADAKLLADLRAEYGLDQPYAVQLARHLGRVVRLDLGTSTQQRRPVLDLIRERLPATLLLTVTAFALALLLGSTLGVMAGLAAGSAADTAFTVLSLVLYAMPVFWLGLMLVLVFSVWLDWLPPFGYGTINARLGPLGQALDLLKYLAMPAASLGAIYLAIYARLMRASIIEVAQQDFVKTARAKGLNGAQIVVGHMLRNALVPVVTVAGMQAGALVGGAVVVETVFAWPGLGRLTFDALLQRDYPVMLGVFLILSVIVILFNLATDLAYRLIDPRMRAGSA